MAARMAEGHAEPACQVYAWGFCTHGQLGIKEKILGAREYIEAPAPVGGSVLDGVEVRAAACGHFHTLLADARGNVYAFGRDDRGQLGRGGEEALLVGEKRGAIPRRITSLSNFLVVDVVCGAFHSLAVTADGMLLSWGWNQSGQLGRYTHSQCDAEPGRVGESRGSRAPQQMAVAAVSVAAGLSHSAAVLGNGQVLAWGSNACGQLGVGPEPELAPLPVFVNGVIGRAVAAGDAHLLVLATDGSVVAAGEASYGRLGPEPFMPEEVEKARNGYFVAVRRLLPLSDDEDAERMRMVAAGGATSAAVTSAGRLFTWGGNSWGQLGHGHRQDSQTPKVVKGLPPVQAVCIAQDHMLAVCSAPVCDPVTGEPLGGGGRCCLWVWGRRRLLPHSLGAGDREAQCFPVEVPVAAFAPAALAATAVVAQGRQEPRPGAAPQLRAVCGGAHSLAFWGPAPSQRARARQLGAAWCPQMSSATGPGTLGGTASQQLQFVITSRNEDGRDEKVGGLRFRVFVERAPEEGPSGGRRATSTRSLRRCSSTSSALEEEERHNFELHSLTDRCDGTYEGVYSMRVPGAYLLHVRMLPPAADDGLGVDAITAQLEEHISGSPFRLAVDSGRAFAPLCALRLRSGGRLRRLEDERPDAAAAPEDAPATAADRGCFMAEASQEVVWEILAKDVLGNGSTLRSDRFSAQVVSSDPAPCGAPDHASKLRRLRGEASAPCVPSVVPLQVRYPKASPGRAELRWTPGAVGSYSLSVSLLPERAGERPPRPIGGSPFDVEVTAGRPSAEHSLLAVVAGPGAARLSGDPPQATLTARVLLRDRVGNPCWQGADPLRHVQVRVESVTLIGDDPEDAAGRPPRLLEWSVANVAGPGALLAVSLTASPALLEAASSAGGGRRRVCLFLSATERVSRQRLAGSPCRLEVELEAPAAPAPAAGATQEAAEACDEAAGAAVDAAEAPPAGEGEIASSAVGGGGAAEIASSAGGAAERRAEEREPASSGVCGAEEGAPAAPPAADDGALTRYLAEVWGRAGRLADGRRAARPPSAGPRPRPCVDAGVEVDGPQVTEAAVRFPETGHMERSKPMAADAVARPRPARPRSSRPRLMAGAAEAAAAVAVARPRSSVPRLWASAARPRPRVQPGDATATPRSGPAAAQPSAEADGVAVAPAAAPAAAASAAVDAAAALPRSEVDAAAAAAASRGAVAATARPEERPSSTSRPSRADASGAAAAAGPRSGAARLEAALEAARRRRAGAEVGAPGGAEAPTRPTPARLRLAAAATSPCAGDALEERSRFDGCHSPVSPPGAGDGVEERSRFGCRSPISPLARSARFVVQGPRSSRAAADGAAAQRAQPRPATSAAAFRASAPGDAAARSAAPPPQAEGSHAPPASTARGSTTTASPARLVGATPAPSGRRRRPLVQLVGGPDGGGGVAGGLVLGSAEPLALPSLWPKAR